MRKFKDDRGRSYCDIFPEIGKGDINVSIVYPGTIKAFHRHAYQDDYWFVISGHLRAVLSKVVLSVTQQVGPPDGSFIAPDTSGSTLVETITKTKFSVDNTVEHYLSEGDILHIPAGIWHGLQCLGNEPAVMIYHITNKYNEDDPDEERAEWDEFHNWEFSRK